MKAARALACIAIFLCSAGFSDAAAQTSKAVAKQTEVRAAMLSDIHFDPFHDPEKVQQLIDAPVSKWAEVLAAPASANQASAFAALQRRCSARGMDASYALLESSLEAAKKQVPNAGFVTVSGDLIAHNFPCRFATVMPGRSQDDYTAFTAKTVQFAISELRRRFPGVPVYVALGNNDSNCGHYHLDRGSKFLALVGNSVFAGLPSSADRKTMLADFADGGYYSVMMAPLRNTRLIVLNDIFMAQQYETCGGKRDSEASAAPIAWLQKELAAARARGETVWILGHIPPGVNVYSTFSKLRNVCEGNAPEMFLSSDALGDVLREDADEIRLAIFAHTHMDELRLLGSKNGEVPIKMISSVSSVDGNNPSFTVATVDASSATLKDYEVFAAADPIGSSWSKEYDYKQAYHQAQFSPAALENLIGEFKNDPDAKTEESQTYIRSFFVGDSSSLIKPLWPQYVCALNHDTAKGFTDCVCSARP